MSIVSINPAFFDQVHLLDESEKLDPVYVFRGLFTDYSLHEVKDTLWDMLHVSLTTDDALFVDAEDRRSVISFTTEITKCLEAVKVFVDLENKRAEQSNPNDPALKYKNIESLTYTELKAAHEYYVERLHLANNKVLQASEYLRRVTVEFTKRNPGRPE